MKKLSYLEGLNFLNSEKFIPLLVYKCYSTWLKNLFHFAQLLLIFHAKTFLNKEIKQNSGQITNTKIREHGSKINKLDNM